MALTHANQLLALCTALGSVLAVPLSAQSKSAIQLYDTTGSGQTAKIGWQGSSSEGHFFVETPSQSGPVKVEKGNLTVNGSVEAQSFSGDGSALSGVPVGEGSVTSSKIAAGAVTTAKIAEKAVTDAKIDSVSWEKVRNKPSIPAGGVANGSVTTSKLADGAVSTAKIGDNAVTDAKIDSVSWQKVSNKPEIPGGTVGDGTITTEKLVDDAVTTAKIADRAVTNAKIDSVSWEKVSNKPEIPGGTVGDGTITTTKLVDEAVTTAKLDNGAVTNGKLAQDAVHGRNLNDTCVTTAHIKDNAVTDAKIQSVSWDKVSGASGIGTGDITGVSAGTGLSGGGTEGDVSLSVEFGGSGSTTTAARSDHAHTGTIDNTRLDEDLQDLADGSLSGSKVGSGIDADSITTGTLPADRIGTGSITGSHIDNYTITNSDISSSASISGSKVNPDFRGHNETKFDRLVLFHSSEGTKVLGMFAGYDENDSYFYLSPIQNNATVNAIRIDNSNLNTHFYGNITHAGTITATSDRRLKYAFQPLSGTLDRLKQIQAVSFRWKSEHLDDGRNIGVVAQDVERVFPELVKESSKGEKSVNYEGLSAILLQATKEQQQSIDKLSKEVQDLTNKVERLMIKRTRLGMAE